MQNMLRRLRRSQRLWFFIAVLCPFALIPDLCPYSSLFTVQSVTAEQLMQFFASAGDVRYVRMAGDETQPTRFAFVEFASVQHVQAAIGMSGAVLGGRLIK